MKIMKKYASKMSAGRASQMPGRAALALGVLLVGLIALPARAQQGAYTLYGKASGIIQNRYTGPQRPGIPAAGKAFLHRYTLEEGQHIDSVTVTDDGTFSFTGTVKAPEIGQLIFLTGDQEQSIVFYLEPGAIHVDCPTDGTHAALSGTALNNDLQIYNGMLNGMLDSLNASRTGEDPYNQFSKEIWNRKLEVVRRFVYTHPASKVSLYQIGQVAIKGVNPGLLDSLFHSLPLALQTTPDGMEVGTRVAGLHSGAIGSLAPAFTLPDTAGRNVSLSDLRGKYVLIDFWATWCVPCLEEMPNVVKAHNRYKARNFVIVGVSLDRPDSKALWLKDIGREHMDWIQVSDLRWWNCKAALAYNVNSVPANFLVDPSGKIIAKNLRGEALQDKLAEIFK
jgi:peroxiredoxin